MRLQFFKWKVYCGMRNTAVVLHDKFMEVSHYFIYF